MYAQEIGPRLGEVLKGMPHFIFYCLGLGFNFFFFGDFVERYLELGARGGLGAEFVAQGILGFADAF